jgi:eukaryotic-like serine/threonine-protein kinase
MAIVYLAEDLRHRRQVAVKVLRPELAATLGPERFLREIETAARLQHPHILPVHDSGEASGFLYYVMPYVDGESLRTRLARHGELPIHDAIKILLEVTDALAYAHEHGVVHRDIKPDNVLLSGRHALVTDFGVAKAVSEATGGQQLTTAGVALGTPTYMAPEQATADPNIDHRADIYSVGVLSYELLTSRPPFTGRSSQEVLAAHMTQRPESLCARRPACPPVLEMVVMRCLEKRPADRWQTADELLTQLEPLATPSGGTTPTATRPIETVVPRSRPSRWRTWLPAAAVLLASAVALALALDRSTPEMRLGRRVQLTLDPGLEIDPALSPDGKLVAFASGRLGQTRLYVRQVDGGAPVAITAERGGFARGPHWSPDGSRLVFRSERGVEVMPALGGAPRLLILHRPDLWIDALWSPDGRSIAYTAGDSILLRPVDGGPARGLARLAEAHSCAWSPNGLWLACVSGNRDYVRNNNFGNIAPSSVWVIPVVGGAPVRVTDDQSLNTSPAWLPSRNSLLFISNRDGGRDIYQMPLARSGRPVREATRLTTGLDAAAVSVSSDGRRLVYAAFTETSNVWGLPVPTLAVRSVSSAEPITTGFQVIEGFDVSPDASWIVFDSDRSGTQQLYRVPIAGGEVEQLTSGAEPAFSPSISPDVREIAYHSFRDGWRQVFVIPAEGGTPSQVTAGGEHHWNARWAPDGRRLTVARGAPIREIDVVSRETQGRWAVSRTLVRGGNMGVWSPDGHLVLTSLVEAGGEASFAIVAATGGVPRVIVPAGMLAVGSSLAFTWSEDGRFVYYLAKEPARTGIWRVPAAGGVARLVVRFDDPTRPWHRLGFRVRGGKFYLTLGDQQSDIWMAELEGLR